MATRTAFSSTLAASSIPRLAASAATSPWRVNSASFLAGSSARRFPEDRSADSGLSLSRRLEAWPFEGDSGGEDVCEGDCEEEGETAPVEIGGCTVDVTKDGSEGGDVSRRLWSGGEGRG